MALVKLQTPRCCLVSPQHFCIHSFGVLCPKLAELVLGFPGFRSVLWLLPLDSSHPRPHGSPELGLPVLSCPNLAPPALFCRSYKIGGLSVWAGTDFPLPPVPPENLGKVKRPLKWGVRFGSKHPSYWVPVCHTPTLHFPEDRFITLTQPTGPDYPKSPQHSLPWVCLVLELGKLFRRRSSQKAMHSRPPSS